MQIPRAAVGNCRRGRISGVAGLLARRADSPVIGVGKVSLPPCGEFTPTDATTRTADAAVQVTCSRAGLPFCACVHPQPLPSATPPHERHGLSRNSLRGFRCLAAGNVCPPCGITHVIPLAPAFRCPTKINMTMPSAADQTLPNATCFDGSSHGTVNVYRGTCGFGPIGQTFPTRAAASLIRHRVSYGEALWLFRPS